MTRLPLIAALCLLPAVGFAGDDHGHAYDDDHKEAEAHDDHAHDDHAGEGDKHLIELDGAEILHAWAQASEGPDARVFMEIEATGDKDLKITGGDAHGLAGSVKLMGAPLSANGDPVALDEMPIAAGSHLDLTPDGVYLLLSGLEKHLDKGDEFAMHIELEPFGEVEIYVEVEAANASNHSHAGHNH